MNFTDDELRSAALATGISSEQTEHLLRHLHKTQTQSGKAKFDLEHVAYYLGALIVIGAMGWFMTTAWEAMGGGGLTVVSIIYAFCFTYMGRKFWNQSGLRIPGGLLLTMAVCMTPLAVYGIERWTGIWPQDDPGDYTNFHPYINGSWVSMELVTIAAGCLMLRFWRFPFITAPVAYALWFLTMDLVALCSGKNDLDWDNKKILSAMLGGLMLIAAYLIDLRGKLDDYAFWLYLFGLLAFWGALSMIDEGGELGKFAYCLVNIGLIICSIILRRKTLIVFGSLGLFGYFGHLASVVFEDSVLFPFALTLLGVGIIFFGVQYSKRRKQLDAVVRAKILPHIRRFVPERALAE